MMDTKEIFLKLRDDVIESLGSKSDWQESYLYIKRLTNSSGFDSSYKNKNVQVIKIDTAVNYETHKVIKELYLRTQSASIPHKKWNRAIFTLFPNNKFQMEYIWDQELQDEVDELSK